MAGEVRGSAKLVQQDRDDGHGGHRSQHNTCTTNGGKYGVIRKEEWPWRSNLKKKLGFCKLLSVLQQSRSFHPRNILL